MKVYTCPHCGWDCEENSSWVEFIKKTNECPWCENKWILVEREQ